MSEPLIEADKKRREAAALEDRERARRPVSKEQIEKAIEEFRRKCRPCKWPDWKIGPHEPFDPLAPHKRHRPLDPYLEPHRPYERPYFPEPYRPPYRPPPTPTWRTRIGGLFGIRRQPGAPRPPRLTC